MTKEEKITEPEEITKVLKQLFYEDDVSSQLKTYLNKEYPNLILKSTRTSQQFDFILEDSSGKIKQIYEIVHKNDGGEYKITQLTYDRLSSYVKIADVYLVYKVRGDIKIERFEPEKIPNFCFFLSSLQNKGSDVNSPLLDFYKEIYRLNQDAKENGLILFFRGHSDKENYKPIPSIYRGKNKGHEYEIAQKAICDYYTDFKDAKYYFEKLEIMQHYGVPTRLLDITKNPLVALYFACCENENCDGEILVYVATQKDDVRYYDEDVVNEMSNLAFKRNIETGKEQIKHTIIVSPVMNNERIKRQSGAFLLFGINKDGDTCSNPLEPCKKITINASNKQAFLNELQYLGINKQFLFPELSNMM